MDRKTGLPEHEYRIWRSLKRAGECEVVAAASLEEACKLLGVRLEDVYVEETPTPPVKRRLISSSGGDEQDGGRLA